MDNQGEWVGNAPDERPRQPRQMGASVIQDLGFSIFGLLILVIDTLALGPIVDYFVDFATTLEILNPSMMSSMAGMVWFGNWFYYILFITGVLFLVYPILRRFGRHKYAGSDAALINDESGW